MKSGARLNFRFKKLIKPTRSSLPHDHLSHDRETMNT